MNIYRGEPISKKDFINKLSELKEIIEEDLKKFSFHEIKN